MCKLVKSFNHPPFPYLLLAPYLTGERVEHLAAKGGEVEVLLLHGDGGAPLGGLQGGAGGGGGADLGGGGGRDLWEGRDDSRGRGNPSLPKLVRCRYRILELREIVLVRFGKDVINYTG